MIKTEQLKTKSVVTAALVLAVSYSAYADDDSDDGSNKRNNALYRIEMHNQTENQWFSPYLCVLHNKRLRLFRQGRAATTGQAVFAEDGFNGVLTEELRNNPNVYSVLQTDAGLTPPGASRIEYMEGRANARLTCAGMPVTTNDVLTTITHVKPPKRLFRPQVFSSTEWDLGSEVNNYSESMALDSVNLAPESPDNPVTISDNVVFGPNGRPPGVPTFLGLGPFTRAFMNSTGQVIAEGTMSVFTHYEGSDEFPAELYGWSGSASRFEVTRVE